MLVARERSNAHSSRTQSKKKGKISWHENAKRPRTWFGEWHRAQAAAAASAVPEPWPIYFLLYGRVLFRSLSSLTGLRSLVGFTTLRNSPYFQGSLPVDATIDKARDSHRLGSSAETVTAPLDFSPLDETKKTLTPRNAVSTALKSVILWSCPVRRTARVFVVNRRYESRAHSGCQLRPIVRRMRQLSTILERVS